MKPESFFNIVQTPEIFEFRGHNLFSCCCSPSPKDRNHYIAPYEPDALIQHREGIERAER